jgi:hypothetical protein
MARGQWGKGQWGAPHRSRWCLRAPHSRPRHWGTAHRTHTRTRTPGGVRTRAQRQPAAKHPACCVRRRCRAQGASVAHPPEMAGVGEVEQGYDGLGRRGARCELQLVRCVTSTTAPAMQLPLCPPVDTLEHGHHRGLDVGQNPIVYGRHRHRNVLARVDAHAVPCVEPQCRGWRACDGHVCRAGHGEVRSIESDLGKEPGWDRHDKVATWC